MKYVVGGFAIIGLYFTLVCIAVMSGYPYVAAPHVAAVLLGLILTIICTGWLAKRRLKYLATHAS